MDVTAIKRFKQLRAIIKSLSMGTSFAQACKGAGIDPVTLWRWRKENKKLDKLLHEIIDSRIQMVEDALFKTAIDGNVVAQLAFLFNRAPDRWKDKRAMPTIFTGDPILAEEIEIVPTNGGMKSGFKNRIGKFINN